MNQALQFIAQADGLSIGVALLLPLFIPRALDRSLIRRADIAPPCA